MKAFLSTGPKMRFMNLLCIVGFVISMTGTMTMSLTMIPLVLTLMMGILLDMIQIEVILQMAPHLLQIAQQLTFAFFGYFSEQYPYLQG